MNSAPPFLPLGRSAYRWREVHDRVEIHRRWGVAEGAVMAAVLLAVAMASVDPRGWMLVALVSLVAAKALWRWRSLPSEIQAGVGAVSARYPTFGGTSLSDSTLRYRLVRSFRQRAWSKSTVVEHRLVARREGEPDLLLVQVVGLSDDDMIGLKRRLGAFNSSPDTP